MRSLLTSCLVLAATGGLLLASSHADDRVLADFRAAESGGRDWRIVDDGVMGGLSKGNVSFTEADTMVFQGEVSLENNGGFSSVRSGTVDLDLGDDQSVKLRVKGDGRTYQLRFTTDARYRDDAVAFKAEFPTAAGEWTEVELPLDSFTGSWRGSELPDVPFDPSKIEGITFLIGDGKAGPFSLEVDWVKAHAG
ncbi:CIA30 family protein [soil metagenome]